MRKLAIGWVLTLVISGALLGCRGESAESMMSTAKFEEVQNNKDHAKQLYERIRTDYPDSPEAEEAGARMQALGE